MRRNTTEDVPKITASIRPQRRHSISYELRDQDDTPRLERTFAMVSRLSDAGRRLRRRIAMIALGVIFIVPLGTFCLLKWTFGLAWGIALLLTIALMLAGALGLQIASWFAATPGLPTRPPAPIADLQISRSPAGVSQMKQGENDATSASVDCRLRRESYVFGGGWSDSLKQGDK